MRLLDTDSHRLRSFVSPPKSYAILSHTWDAEEVLFQDATGGYHAWETNPGASKVLSSAKVAKELGFGLIWIDSCCIDKNSSAELSEAINSMFRWYEGASLCLAYLSDLRPGQEGKSLADCRWFTRGWTLQELLAPPEIHFFDATWHFIGSRSSMSTQLSGITHIQLCELEHPLSGSINRISVYERMAWAANRRTTREEDMSYCLLGIFQVNLPLLYGEGGREAFRRLQEEILRDSNDLSILFHDGGTDRHLADSVVDFKPPLKLTVHRNQSLDYSTWEPSFGEPATAISTARHYGEEAQPAIHMIKGGLRVLMTVCIIKSDVADDEMFGILDHDLDDDETAGPRIAIHFKRSGSVWRRTDSSRYLIFPGGHGEVALFAGSSGIVLTGDLPLPELDLSKVERKEVVLYNDSHFQLSRYVEKEELSWRFLDLQWSQIRAKNTTRRYAFGPGYPKSSGKVIRIKRDLLSLSSRGQGCIESLIDIKSIVWITSEEKNTTIYHCIIAVGNRRFWGLEYDGSRGPSFGPDLVEVLVPVEALYGLSTLTSDHTKINDYLTEGSILERLRVLSKADGEQSEAFWSAVEQKVPVRIGDTIVSTAHASRSFFGTPCLILSVQIGGLTPTKSEIYSTQTEPLWGRAIEYNVRSSSLGHSNDSDDKSARSADRGDKYLPWVLLREGNEAESTSTFLVTCKGTSRIDRQIEREAWKGTRRQREHGWFSYLEETKKKEAEDKTHLDLDPEEQIWVRRDVKASPRPPLFTPGPFERMYQRQKQTTWT